MYKIYDLILVKFKELFLVPKDNAIDEVADKDQESRDKFHNLMRRANKLAYQKNIEGLYDLMKIVLKPIQSLHIRDAYLREKDDLKFLDWRYDLNIDYVPTADGYVTFFNSIQPYRISDIGKYTIDLKSDTVLPTAWNNGSMINTLGKIGESQDKMDFIQDSNHLVTWWLPFNFGWVDNGNHSIIQGVLSGQGVIKPHQVFDLSSLIDIIVFDGVNWVSKESNEIIGVPRYPEFGWCWEIGRLITQLKEI